MPQVSGHGFSRAKKETVQSAFLAAAGPGGLSELPLLAGVEIVPVAPTAPQLARLGIKMSRTVPAQRAGLWRAGLDSASMVRSCPRASS